VRSATLARTSPMTPFSFGYRLMLPSGGEPITGPSLMIYPRYFATMGITIVQGRDFNDDDLRPDSPQVAIVNEAFVRRWLNGRQPLGVQHGLTAAVRRRGQGPAPVGRPVNIIGVVKDSRYPALREAAPPTMYETFLQASTGFGQMVLHVKVADRSSDLIAQVREAVQAVDRDAPMFQLHTLADEVDAALVRERLVATLSAFFGIVALVLIAVGLYGLMAFTVSRRTAEIGVRLALGATRANVRWMIARQALGLVLAGLAAGVPAAWIVGLAASRQLSGMLFELTPTDPLTITVSVVVLALVGACAGVLPARRAVRIDPMVALRAE
jgi:predicted permease